MIEWSARLGALEALERGCTAIIDHHESPSAIEGSLDVIVAACADVGVRVSCAYGVTDRHGADGAARGLAENDRHLSGGGRGMVGVHAAFTCSDDTLAAAAELAVRHGVGVHVHVAEGAADIGAAERLAASSADDWLLVHGVHLPDDHGLRGTIVHNPRSNMNNAVGYAAPTRFANPVALGTDGIGADMLDELRLGYVRLREHDITETPDTVWAWLAEGWELFPEARDDRVRWSYQPVDPWRLAFTPGVNPVEVVVDGEGRARRWPSHAGRRRRDSRPRRRAGGAVVRCPGGDAMTRYALYLQDAHPIREAMDHVRYAEAAGFEAVWQADSRLVREAGVPMAAFAATTDSIAIGSGVIDVWTRNPARLASLFSTLDDLAPGRILCGLGAWWDPLAAKVGIDRAKPLRVMREVVEAVRALLANETVTMSGTYVHLDGVELDYVSPGAPGQGRAHLHRGDRSQDDGADRRDRRRRGAELSRQPRLQPASDGPARDGRRARRPQRRRPRPSPSSWCARSTRIARPRSTGPGCSSPSTSASNPTS